MTSFIDLHNFLLSHNHLSDTYVRLGLIIEMNTYNLDLNSRKFQYSSLLNTDELKIFLSDTEIGFLVAEISSYAVRAPRFASLYWAIGKVRAEIGLPHLLIAMSHLTDLNNEDDSIMQALLVLEKYILEINFSEDKIIINSFRNVYFQILLKILKCFCMSNNHLINDLVSKISEILGLENGTF